MNTHTYLVEGYLAEAAASDLAGAARPVAEATTALSRPGRSIRYLLALHLPGEELCLHIFEATAAEVVLEAVTLAGLRHVRVLEAVAEPAFEG